MELSLKKEEVLESAIGGISRVAEAIAALRSEDHAKALDAAERSYRQTALDLGYPEAAAQVWTAAVMFRLRTELAELSIVQAVELRTSVA